jgi:hypothetical protein
LIFENTGICLFSKNYYPPLLGGDDDLATGFLSVLYGFLDDAFGKLTSICTEKNILLITKFQDIYITLVIERIELDDEIVENDRRTLLNKRLENACRSQLRLIERKVGSTLLQLKIRKEKDVNYRDIFSGIECEFDEMINHGLRKIQVIKKVFENHPITNALEMYKN